MLLLRRHTRTQWPLLQCRAGSNKPVVPWRLCWRQWGTFPPALVVAGLLWAGLGHRLRRGWPSAYGAGVQEATLDGVATGRSCVRA